MQFYTLNDDNTISASADFRWTDDCLETDREIIRGWDGKLYFAGEEPEPPPPVEPPEPPADPMAYINAILGVSNE